MAEPPKATVTVAGVSAPAPGQAVRVSVNGVPVAVFNRDGQLYAIGAACTHATGPLEKGMVSDHQVRCPWHGSVFDLETGQVVQGPARTPEPAYRVRAEGNALVFEPK